MTAKPNKEILEIVDQLHAEGYDPKTPQFQFLFLKRRVERCQELRGAPSCQACYVFDHCELAKAHLRNIAEIEYRHAMEKKRVPQNQG